MGSRYHRFVRWLAGYLGHDCVFERDPQVRYHIPGRFDDRYRLPDGSLCSFHSDTLLRDYFQQVNVWLPLCDVRGTAALAVVDYSVSLEVLEAFAAELDYCSIRFRSARAEFFQFLLRRHDLRRKIQEASSPVEMKYGQCLLFDPRVLHGTAENIENETRVSIDFRIVPMDYYKIIINEIHQQGWVTDQYEGDSLERGYFYDAKTAYEF